SGIPSIDTPSVSPSPIGLDFGPARLGLRVVRAGLQCTIQDDGRYGLASLGYATAGALDRHALRLANRLVGNPPGSACIELAVDGGEFEAVSDCVIAVTGADLGPAIDGMPITTCRAAWLRTGMRLSFDRPRPGMRAYLAVAGGFATPIVLGSRSTDLLAGIGGLDGRALRAGDVLPLLRSVEHSTVGFTCEPLAIPGHESEIVLRTVWGPQANWFDQHMRNLFTQATFVVSPRSDRTGLRLSGSAIQVTNTSDLASEGGVPGVVQIPPDGQPIILLADSRGVGGYPKLATVIGADLSRLAYAAPGMRVRFESTTVQDASIATRNAMAAIANTPLRPVPELDVRCLQESLAWPDERSWLCPRTFACAVSQRCSSGPIESEHDTQPG
ncbi:MAG: allophanate hydrolase subunit 2, partial [Chloroflexi bacterium]|nr:allophanate hydrolase subunit 2 [Chloroflexota bacterium]